MVILSDGYVNLTHDVMRMAGKSPRSATIKY